jgi:hypothetical protein
LNAGTAAGKRQAQSGDEAAAHECARPHLPMQVEITPTQRKRYATA